MRYCGRAHWDDAPGGFYDVAPARATGGTTYLATRAKPIQDSPTPSPNGVAGPRLPPPRGGAGDQGRGPAPPPPPPGFAGGPAPPPPYRAPPLQGGGVGGEPPPPR